MSPVQGPGLVAGLAAAVLVAGCATKILEPASDPDMGPSIDLVASGQVDVTGFVTATYPHDRTPEAFEEYERNPGRILRIVIAS